MCVIMLLNYIWYSQDYLVFSGIRYLVYSLVFSGIRWYSPVFTGIQWYSGERIGIRWYSGFSVTRRFSKSRSSLYWQRYTR